MGIKKDVFLNGVLIESIDTRTDEDKKNEIRVVRQPLLAEADIQIMKHEDTDTNSSLWRAYRVALRDVTLQEDLDNITWPEKPDLI